MIKTYLAKSKLYRLKIEKLIIVSAFGQSSREDVGKASTESMIWFDRPKIDDIFNLLGDMS